MSAVLSKAIPDGAKKWLVASLAVLLLSLALVLGDVVAAFVYFADKSDPLWVTLLGVAGAFGVAMGFGGFFVLMAFAGWRSLRESRRVQVIPPVHRSESGN
ncbi:hypothetical protein [Granulicella sp. S190]|uniref:hypothetical protein n=1 Tax=Granulicella sp. S190 TaxID=1747226 RepID=UPI00131B2D64|nr:hypothetical protein [Granulicella sp. S190]